MDKNVKIGIALDNKVNKWALQHFEPLQDKYDITVFVGQRNDYDVSSIVLKKVFLRHSQGFRSALLNPLEIGQRDCLIARKSHMDF